MTRLDKHTSAAIGQRIPVPTYDRSQLVTGIVHIGVGGFHRAHQAMYVDALMNTSQASDWAITGIGLLPQDAKMHAALTGQDMLYTLVLKHPDGSLEPRVIGSLTDYILASAEPVDALRALTDPRTRIVSLTVTEGGYHVNQATGEFDADDPAIEHDLRSDVVPQSTFGILTAALAARRASKTAPFTVMSCDNIQGNGTVTQRMLTAFAYLKDPGLAAWIENEVAFPNSMVDRITPVTSDTDRDALADQFGVEDAWPVVCEPYTQWVLEDRFPTGRPALEQVGVQLVPDVQPYELMKLRLLNASHQALCYLGYLSGYRYAHEVCTDPLFVRFLRGYMNHEAAPTLAPVPGVDVEQYKGQLIERFANPEVRDTLARLCAETSDRIPKWLVPVVRSQLASGGDVRRSALVVAAWARYAEGIDEAGAPIEVVDRRRDQVMARARRQREEPLAFLEDRQLFGDLAHNETFAGLYRSALESLHSIGARATLERWTGRHR